MIDGLTFSEVSKIFGSTDAPKEDDGPDLLLRRIRSFDARGLVVAQRGDSGVREGYLDLEQACRCIVFHELMELGFDGEVLRSLRRALIQRDDPTGPTAMGLVIAAIRRGVEPAQVQLVIHRLKRKTPKGYGHVFRFTGIGDGMESRVSPENTGHACVTLDLGALLSRFTAGFDTAMAKLRHKAAKSNRINR
ncbi:hypothetical protein D2N39_11525 [Gemmobacter lutimaris]|uniref:HTH merR-type domain-containing protein n=1 Tax=Gemmobacter lutimaris TaxID=2306023 RepID=A0A398BVF2_9RHOB|nr:hypothetical protein [Gemmobacter lutimaris]RID91860.1 hypothetical protein D2N39_11525 [Gemmobacter lutimaris]